MGIVRQCLRDWAIDEEKLLLVENKNQTFRLPGDGRYPEYQYIEEDLCNFIDYLRSIGITVSTIQMIIKERYCQF